MLAAQRYNAPFGAATSCIHERAHHHRKSSSVNERPGQSTSGSRTRPAHGLSGHLAALDHVRCAGSGLSQRVKFGPNKVSEIFTFHSVKHTGIGAHFRVKLYGIWARIRHINETYLGAFQSKLWPVPSRAVRVTFVEHELPQVIAPAMRTTTRTATLGVARSAAPIYRALSPHPTSLRTAALSRVSVSTVMRW